MEVLSSFLKRYYSTVDLVTKKTAGDGYELRESTIVENVNWTNWILHPIVYRALSEVNKVVLNDLESAKKVPKFREFIDLQTKFISCPSLEILLKNKTIAEYKVPDIKPNFELEFSVRESYAAIIGKLIGSA